MQNIEFINAGAGSGKTYSLTKKLSDLIKNKECRADEIILTTFTENAAAELTGKAREALLKERLIEEAGLLASSCIGTVHSVALSFVEKYWYLSGSGTRLQVMPEEDQGFYINQAVSFIPEPGEISRLNDLTVLLDFKDERSFPDFSKWKSDLKRVVELSLSNRINGFDDSLEQSVEEIDTLFGTDNHQEFLPVGFKRALTILLTTILHERASAARSKRIRRIKGFLSLPDNPGFHHYRSLYSYLTGANNLTNGHKQIPEVAALIGSLSTVETSDILRDASKEYAGLVFRLAGRSIDAYRQYKLEHNLIDFNDMEVRFLQLLDHPEARTEISNRYKILLVDEFQDSNPIQIEIFKKLSGILRKSFWVGDPKQAIYGFRGTDSELVDAILKEFGRLDGRNLTIGEPLRQSWRSRPELVSLANNIFSIAFAGNLEYIPLNPVRNEGELPEDEYHAPVQEWEFTPRIQSLEEYYHHTASEISKIISQHRIRVVDKAGSRLSVDRINTIVTRELVPGDIAVLGRQKEHLYKMAKALNNFGIQVSGEQKELIETAEVSLLVALLNYYLDERDSLAKATIKLLAGSDPDPSGVIDDRLDYLSRITVEDTGEETVNFEDNWCNELEILQKLNGFKDSSRHLSVSNLVDKLLIVTALPDYVSRWSNPLQRKNNLQWVRNLSVRYENRSLAMGFVPSVRGFIEYLSELKGEDIRTATVKGENAVNVITYHKAKGLEWPVVILTDLEFDPLDDSRLIRKEFFGVSLDSDGPVNLDKSFEGKVIIILPWFSGSRSLPVVFRNRLIEMPRFQRCREKVLREARRLMYVGITRARDILISSIYKPEILSSVNCLYEAGYNPQDQVNIFKTSDPAKRWTLQYENSDYPGYQPGSFDVLSKPGSVDQNDPLMVSPSKMPAIQKVEVRIVAESRYRIIRKESTDDDALVGDCIHDIFYIFDAEMNDLAFDRVTQIIRQFGLNGILTHPESIMDSAKYLLGYLRNHNGAPVKIHRELLLQMVRDGVVYSGSADLVWETEDALVLVDYKSYSGQIGHVVNPEHEKFSGRYSGQLALYKEMLEKCHPEKKPVKDCLIYYAVMGVIVKMNFV